MRRLFLVVSLSILSGCAQGCSLARALYVALVHNSGAPPKEERERIGKGSASVHSRRSQSSHPHPPRRAAWEP